MGCTSGLQPPLQPAPWCNPSPLKHSPYYLVSVLTRWSPCWQRLPYPLVFLEVSYCRHNAHLMKPLSSAWACCPMQVCAARQCHTLQIHNTILTAVSAGEPGATVLTLARPLTGLAGPSPCGGVAVEASPWGDVLAFDLASAWIWCSFSSIASITALWSFWRPKEMGVWQVRGGGTKKADHMKKLARILWSHLDMVDTVPRQFRLWKLLPMSGSSVLLFGSTTQVLLHAPGYNAPRLRPSNNVLWK